ncbi:AAA family ATPase, partial [Streptomyces sp. NPDC000941]
ITHDLGVMRMIAEPNSCWRSLSRSLPPGAGPVPPGAGPMPPVPPGPPVEYGQQPPGARRL